MLKTITKIKVLSSNSFGGVNNIVLNIENLKKAYIWKPCDQKFWRITVYFSFDISSIDKFDNEDNLFQTQKEAITFAKKVLKMNYTIQRERSLKNLQKIWGLK
tara:strand:- start:626 stop:934 length:309 start_codon:yes stop_codon:yes gene_type:complete